MKQLVQKPYLFFWGLVPLILLASFLLGGTVYYLNAYDVHLAVPYRELGFLFASGAFALGAGYWMVLRGGRKLSARITAIHLVATLVGPIGALLATLLHREIELPVTDLLQYAADTQYNDRILLASYALWLVTIFGQAAFLINLFLAFRGKPGKH